MNMNFLPKNLLDNDVSYDKMTEDILKTIDFVERAQKKQEDKVKERLKAQNKKNNKKVGFWEDLFANFQCGHCGEANTNSV